MDEVYTRLAAKLGRPDSEHIARIFEYATSPRQARVLETLNQPPEPALTVEQLAE